MLPYVNLFQKAIGRGESMGSGVGVGKEGEKEGMKEGGKERILEGFPKTGFRKSISEGKIKHSFKSG